MIRRYLNVVRGQETEGREHLEVETSLSLPVEYLERLQKDGLIKIIGGRRICQTWLYAEGTTASSYRARVRAETVLALNGLSLRGPNVPLDPTTHTTYTQTVKHILDECTSLEVTTELTKATFEMIANLNLTIYGQQEIVKDRIYLYCKGMNPLKVIVSADNYNLDSVSFPRGKDKQDEPVRIEFELADGLDASLAGLTIPDYFYGE